MASLFLRAINMSISAGWIVLAVMLLRPLLKKAPRWIPVLLWGIVALRLVLPVSVESALSLIPSAETVSPEILSDATPSVSTGIPLLDSTINPVIGESFAPAPGASANPLQTLIPLMGLVWLLGIAAMLLYTGISVLRLRRRIGTAVHLQDNIFSGDGVTSPFVFGMIRPRIYLPRGINAEDAAHVIAHERAHIRRRDHWWKPLGFLLLSLYWFHPLLWLGYALLCRDIELACDESVIRKLNSEQKADYSQALLSCSVNRRLIAACPLAFGEVGVKERVKSVLNYKKPSLWILIAAVLASIALAVCFLTNPKDGLSAVRHQKSGSELPGLSLEIASLETDAPDPRLSVRYKNKSSERFIFGEEHYIYKKVDGAWEDCRTSASVVWHLVAYAVEPKASATHAYALNGNIAVGYSVKSVLLSSNLSYSYAYTPMSYIMTEPGEYRFETKFFIEGKPDVKYTAWIEFELTCGVDTVSVHTFEPEALVYADGSYSFVQTAENAPAYRLVNGMHLQEIASDGAVKSLGSMERITLSEGNFDSRFWWGSESWTDRESLSGLRRRNSRAWQLTLSEGDLHQLYLLLEQEDGTFYLGYGYYGTPGEGTRNPDDSHVRWLYRLAGVKPPSGSETGTEPTP
ncbi:MAG: hypothetical protein IKL89_03740 [Clostridia bacterium]|nr:hypothetical protein [Clostridia bacterium]